MLQHDLLPQKNGKRIMPKYSEIDHYLVDHRNCFKSVKK